MVKLMISVPCFDGTIKSKCSESIGNAAAFAYESMPISITRFNVYGYQIARARNFMAQAALDRGYDYILMVDSDMVLPKNALVNLLENDVEVCLGFYVRGDSDDGMTNMVKAVASTNGDCHRASELRAMDGKLIEVRRGGFGCALLNTDVFRRFSRPWFEYHDHPDGSGLSEDYDFCRKCYGAGIKVYVDTRVGCGHIHDRLLEAV